MKTTSHLKRTRGMALAALLACSASDAQTTHTWTQIAGGAQAWDDTTNWLGGTIPNPVSGDTIDLSTVDINTTTLTLDADRTAEVWRFGDASGGNTWTVNAGNEMVLAGTTPTIDVVNNTATLNNVIAGTAGLTKDGPGTLVLGAVNTYSGGTVINGGQVTVSNDTNLGDAGGGLTFGGTATLRMNVTGESFNRDLTLTDGVVATLDSVRNNFFTATNPVTGTGGVHIRRGTGWTYLTLESTANTFTGPITAQGGDRAWVRVNSLVDGAGAITLLGGQGRLIYQAGVIAPLVLDSRQVVVDSGGGYIQNDSDTHTITINTDLGANTTAATLRLYGNSSLPNNAFNGDIADGAAALSVDANHWGELTGTNTYTGITTLTGGRLTIRGTQAMSTSSKILMRRSTTLALMTDDAGTVNLGNEVEMNAIDTSSGIVSQYTVDVSNNGGATTGSTLVLGKVDFVENAGNPASSRQFNVTGDNGYGLQIGDVDLSYAIRGTRAGGPHRFKADAPLEITGTIKQIDGNNGSSSRDNNLALLGTASGLVSGTIADADDFPANPDATPLNVYKGEAGEWSFPGANPYSGDTTVAGGTLNANATGALGGGSVTVTGGTLVIGGTDAMATTGTLTLPSASTLNLQMDADQTVAKLYLGGVRMPSGEYTAATNAGSWMSGSATLTVGNAPPAYWDIDGATAGAGGSAPAETWNASNTFWNDAAGTGTAAAWTAGDTATFAAGGDADGTYAVTVVGTHDVGGLTFEEGDVTLSGGTALNLTTDAVAFVESGFTATVATPISNDGTPRPLEKSGDGTLVLSAANTHGGDTVLSSGTLQLTDPDAIPGLLRLSAGSLAIDANLNLDALIIDSSQGQLVGVADETDSLAFGGTNTILIDRVDATIRAGITGSPDVTAINRGFTNNGFWAFEPAADVTQALGTIACSRNPANGTNSQLRLGGASTGNVADRVTWEITGNQLQVRKQASVAGATATDWTINQDISLDDGRIYVDEGTLILSGTDNFMSHSIQVEDGGRIVLQGNWRIHDENEDFRVKNGGTVAPGASVGTVTFNWNSSRGDPSVGLVDLQAGSTYEWEVGAGNTTDTIAITEPVANGEAELVVASGSTLKVVNAGGTPSVGDQLTVFTYDAGVVTPDTATLNANMSIDISGTSYTGTPSFVNDGAGTIYITGLSSDVVSSPYELWAASFGLTGGDAAPTADPDLGGLGKNNFFEFAFDGDPTTGLNEGRVFSLVADSDVDADSDPELLFTIAVRTGTVFTGGNPATSGATDGIIYSVRGSDGVTVDGTPYPGNVTVSVAPTAVVPAGAPALSNGYEWVTLSLDGSTGGLPDGYLRAEAAQAP